jgi:hypothetical protein
MEGQERDPEDDDNDDQDRKPPAKVIHFPSNNTNTFHRRAFRVENSKRSFSMPGEARDATAEVGGSNSRDDDTSHKPET